MNNDKNKLIVTKIEDGTVIDRIPPGKALRVLEVLGIDSNYPYTVALAMRVASRKMTLKDVVKIRGKANPYSRDGQGYFAKRKYGKYSKPFDYNPYEVTGQLGHLNAEVGLRRA